MKRIILVAGETLLFLPMSFGYAVKHSFSAPAGGIRGISSSQRKGVIP
ncbi:MAG TPA: hypothetical protein VMT31_00475 [Methanomicrobiales archaeon]|nr:hypothetical protein [Methanomicrobiales archaeon]